jgi:hypothetical protein
LPARASSTTKPSSRDITAYISRVSSESSIIGTSAGAGSAQAAALLCRPIVEVERIRGSEAAHGGRYGS